MVNQGDQQLAAQRRQEVDAKQLAFEDFAGHEQGAQARHRGANRRRSDGKIVEDDRALRRLRVEHRVIEAAVLMPDAEFGAQPVVLRRGRVHGGFGQRVGREVGFEALELGRELRGVVGGVDAGERHGRAGRLERFGYVKAGSRAGSKTNFDARRDRREGASRSGFPAGLNLLNGPARVASPSPLHRARRPGGGGDGPAWPQAVRSSGGRSGRARGCRRRRRPARRRPSRAN